MVAEMQYDMNGLLLGPGTRFQVEHVDFAEPSRETNDATLPRNDSVLFGRDYERSRDITFDLQVLTTGSASDALDSLYASWRDSSIRKTPGRTVVLKWQRDGRIRRVYGRPRGLKATTGSVKRGWVPCTALFTARDPYFYADTEEQTTIPLVPPSATGLLVPAQAPFRLVGESSGQGTVTVDGHEPAPLRLRIYGPITDPTVTVVSEWEVTLRGSIASDDWVEVDALEHTIVSKFNVNWAGNITARSRHLEDIALEPGQHSVTLTGTDPTGTSSVDVFHRTTYLSF